MSTIKGIRAQGWQINPQRFVKWVQSQGHKCSEVEDYFPFIEDAPPNVYDFVDLSDPTSADLDLQTGRNPYHSRITSQSCDCMFENPELHIPGWIGTFKTGKNSFVCVPDPFVQRLRLLHFRRSMSHLVFST